jgi:hypothetical protein
MTRIRRIFDGAQRRLRQRLRNVAASTLDLIPAEETTHVLAPVDLRGLGLDPEDALARAGKARFVIDMPLSDCRGNKALGFPCVSGAGHPFIETARLLLVAPDTPYEKTPLHDFYRRHRPRTVAEHLGVAGAHPDLARHPSAAAYPWASPPGPREEARRRARVQAENRRHGVRFGPDNGFAHFGPITTRRGNFELARLRRLVSAVRDEGFHIGADRDGVCSAHLLLDGAQRRALIENGQHRIAVLAALGRRAAPIWMLPQPVRRSRVDDWPGVRAGVFTRDQALAVFDRIMAGRQPEARGMAAPAPAPKPQRRFALRAPFSERPDLIALGIMAIG